MRVHFYFLWHMSFEAMLSTVFVYVTVVNVFTAFANSDIVHSNKSSDDYVACERGWYYYRDNCYRAEGGKGKDLIWPTALVRCREYGADLVSIHSQEEQDPRKRSPNLKYCSTEDGGGLKFKTSCYHLVTEMQTWSNAEIYCKSNYNGHLLTIRDKFQDLFIEYAFRGIKTETWIGIKIQKQLQQKWTSGWFVTTEKFNNGEKYKEDTCIARNNRKEWITIPCSRELPFICEVTKETPPVLKSPPNGSYCLQEFDDWRDFGGDYCYYIQTNTKVNFSEARSHCKGRGGDLVSIHSQEETDFLHPFIKNTGESIYIGLNRGKGITGKSGKLFGWTDGSVLDYKNWDTKEPNKEEEECVEVLTLTMKWRDTLCGNELSGYICSAKKILPSTDVAPVTDDCSRHVSLKTLIGVSVSIHLLIILLNVVM